LVQHTKPRSNSPSCHVSTPNLSEPNLKFQILTATTTQSGRAICYSSNIRGYSGVFIFEGCSHLAESQESVLRGSGFPCRLRGFRTGFGRGVVYSRGGFGGVTTDGCRARVPQLSNEHAQPDSRPHILVYNDADKRRPDLTIRQALIRRR
jgi:hypothetical protein